VRVGLAVTETVRQGYRLHLTSVVKSVWRATFSYAPPVAVENFGMGPMPWRPVQDAAWATIRYATVKTVWLIGTDHANQRVYGMVCFPIPPSN
jgi:hypothetical protein